MKKGQETVLVGIHDVLEMDCAAVDLLLQYREDSDTAVSAHDHVSVMVWRPAYSGGFAGSITVAFFVLSSTTR